jgi:hypothetical protein
MNISRSALPAVLALSAASAAFAQEGIAGHWEGALALPQRSLTLTVDLKPDAGGAWTGSFGIPDAKAVGLQTADLRVEGKSVRFNVPEAPGRPEFELTLGEDGELSGNMSAGGQSAPLRLKRTGEANVVVIPPSPAVPREFEGSWEGRVEFGGRSLRVVLHLENQPGKTVKASFDSPDQNAAGIRVASVVVEGNTLGFQIPAAGASFQGALDKESGAIKGEFTQRGNTLPLELKKAPAR